MSDVKWTDEQRMDAAKFVEFKMKSTGVFKPDGFPIEEVWAIVDESWDRLHGDNKENFTDTIETSLLNGMGDPIVISVYDVQRAVDAGHPVAEAPAPATPTE